MSDTTHKRGTTFIRDRQLLSGAEAINITECNIDAAMVWTNGTRVVLTVTATTPLEGRYRVSAASEDQANWPLGDAVWDVVFSFATSIVATRTFRIEIEKEVAISSGYYVP
jgi:hypothetical protein